MLRSDEFIHLVRERAADFGVRGVDPEKLYFDLAATVARKDSIVAGIHDGIYKALGKNKNITFLKGHAEFVSPVDIRVDDRMINAEKTILAVGSQTAPVMIPGLEEAGYITNNEALKLEDLPDSMIIIGGGYIGVEFAQMYARYGTRVTLLGREVDYRVVPHVVFTDPALASVGLTEAQARDLGHEVKIGTSRFADSGRAKALAQTEGMVKIILDAENDEILGAHILGAHADILIHEVVVAMYDHGKVDSISKSIHVHPTLSEIVKSAAKNAK